MAAAVAAAGASVAASVGTSVGAGVAFAARVGLGWGSTGVRRGAGLAAGVAVARGGRVGETVRPLHASVAASSRARTIDVRFGMGSEL